jgi:hypothetical protein
MKAAYLKGLEHQMEEQQRIAYSASYTNVKGCYTGAEERGRQNLKCQINATQNEIRIKVQNNRTLQNDGHRIQLDKAEVTDGE